jgi:hypothetical protein
MKKILIAILVLSTTTVFAEQSATSEIVLECGSKEKTSTTYRVNLTLKNGLYAFEVKDSAGTNLSSEYTQSKIELYADKKNKKYFMIAATGKMDGRSYSMPLLYTQPSEDSADVLEIQADFTAKDGSGISAYVSDLMECNPKNFDASKFPHKKKDLVKMLGDE